MVVPVKAASTAVLFCAAVGAAGNACTAANVFEMPVLFGAVYPVAASLVDVATSTRASSAAKLVRTAAALSAAVGATVGAV